MKFRKRILWGIILLMLTAGLFLSVFFPEISPFYGIAVWKWFLGAVLLYWFIDHAVFGKSLCEHFDVFLPLGLGFMLFKSNIGRLSGVDFDLVNNWAVLGISVLLTVVVHLLFGSRSNDSDSTEETSSNNNETHRKRILWRIILLMLAVGLFLSVFFPEISPFYGITVWKWFLGAVLLCWLIDHAVFGESLCERLDASLPLGLGFMLFKSDIGRLSGVDFDLINNNEKH